MGTKATEPLDRRTGLQQPEHRRVPREALGIRRPSSGPPPPARLSGVALATTSRRMQEAQAMVVVREGRPVGWNKPDHWHRQSIFTVNFTRSVVEVW